MATLTAASLAGEGQQKNNAQTFLEQYGRYPTRLKGIPYHRNAFIETPGVGKSQIVYRTTLGEDRQTRAIVAVENAERQSGCYVLGVQGVGKSSLLESMINQDLNKGYAMIVLDPHGDLIDHVIAQMPEKRVKDAYVLDIEDAAFPFGLNLLTVPRGANDVEKQRAHDRMLHVFEKCFPDTSHMLLEKYLGNIAPVFFAHPGYTIAEIPKFLRDDTFRKHMLSSKAVRLFVREFWEEEYEGMSASRRQTETASLSTRLNRFVRSPIVGNIIGQSSTTIDFRRAIENKEIIFIRLPIKTLPEDAAFIGTMLIAQIHAAIFSFGDLPLEKRPGFSLFVDEFQHFATSDFAEMFTEGRKFGSRVTVAHQFRGQIPEYLASATLTARTKICFQAQGEDAGKIAALFVQEPKNLRTEDIFPHVVKHLLTYGHSERTIDWFIKQYLQQVQSAGRKIKVTSWDAGAMKRLWGYDRKKEMPEVDNPLALLNTLLYEAETKKKWDAPIPYEVLMGFSNCGDGFYNTLRKAVKDGRLSEFQTVKAIENKSQTRALLSGSKEEIDQCIDFLVTLRSVMAILSLEPLGEKKKQSVTEVAQQIISLPRRHALVKIGEGISEIKTLDTPIGVSGRSLELRKIAIKEHTRERYCRPVEVVEEEIYSRRQSNRQFSQQTIRTTASASIICPQCGAEQTNTRFCSSCGQSLATSTQEQAQPRKRFVEDEE
jgi:GTPase SAR1 family protein